MSRDKKCLKSGKSKKSENRALKIYNLLLWKQINLKNIKNYMG